MFLKSAGNFVPHTPHAATRLSVALRQRPKNTGRSPRAAKLSAAGLIGRLNHGMAIPADHTPAGAKSKQHKSRYHTEEKWENDCGKASAALDERRSHGKADQSDDQTPGYHSSEAFQVIQESRFIVVGTCGAVRFKFKFLVIGHGPDIPAHRKAIGETAFPSGRPAALPSRPAVRLSCPFRIVLTTLYNRMGAMASDGSQAKTGIRPLNGFAKIVREPSDHFFKAPSFGFGQILGIRGGKV